MGLNLIIYTINKIIIKYALNKILIQNWKIFYWYLLIIKHDKMLVIT